MDFLLLAILFVISGLQLWRGINDTGKMYEYPFWASLTFFGFIALPAIGLLGNNYIPADGYTRYIFMSILCLIAIIYGDRAGNRAKLVDITKTVYSDNKLRVGATVLILLGLFAHFKWRIGYSLGLDTRHGILTILVFFTAFLRFGFILSVIDYLRNKNKYSLFLILLGASYYLDKIVFFGRRQIALELVFTLLFAFWFVFSKKISRLALVGVVIGGAIFFFSIGQYRSVVVSPTGDRDWSKLFQIDLKKGVTEAYTEGGGEDGGEVEKGIFLISGIAQEYAFDYGMFHWNELVNDFLPGQIIGQNVKESFCIILSDPLDLANKYYHYIPNWGLTPTGIVDCFGSFWYFGAIKFYLIAYIMRYVSRRAICGEVKYQIIYIYTLTMALHAITHHTQWFVSSWVTVGCFLFPILFFSKAKV